MFTSAATIHTFPDSPTRFHVTDLKEREWIFEAGDSTDRGNWCAAIKAPKRYLAGKEEEEMQKEHVDYDKQLDNVLDSVIISKRKRVTFVNSICPQGII